MTNHYDHQIVDWPDEVCSDCGFKSLKPTPFSEEMEQLLKSLANKPHSNRRDSE